MDENQKLHEGISEENRKKELYSKISRAILNMEIEMQEILNQIQKKIWQIK